MTPEEQRIAIAEACGWTHICKDSKHCETWGTHPKYGIKDLPNYINDLNACHEMEKVLQDAINGQCKKYYENLFYTLMRDDGEPSRFGILHATASQRAEAFLKTIGKWKPSTVPKCDSRREDKDDALPSKVRVAPSDKSDDEEIRYE